MQNRGQFKFPPGTIPVGWVNPPGGEWDHEWDNPPPGWGNPPPHQVAYVKSAQSKYRCSLQDAIQSDFFTRKPRRNELFRSATAKPVMVYCRPPDYTARDGLHIADGVEPWCGPARRLANPRVARTSGCLRCALLRPVSQSGPGPGHATQYSANVLWRPRFSSLPPCQSCPREPSCPSSKPNGGSYHSLPAKPPPDR